MTTNRPFLFDLNFDELTEIITSYGEQKFRAKQVWEWMYKKPASSFDEMSDVPKKLREKLKEEIEFTHLEPHIDLHSTDGHTRKILFNLPGKSQVETVLMGYHTRRTACISTQAGCALGCTFCATGQGGLQRNITSGEIVEQVMFFDRVLQKNNDKLTNLVFMGMGEPFLNYDNMLRSLQILTSEHGLQMSSRKITVSTVGFKGKIKKFADDITLPENASLKNVKLALSLHSTDNGIREAIIPTSVKNRLSDLYDELVYFYRKTKNKITYEYIYFEGLNDTKNDISRLEKLTRMVPSNINIIPFHPIDFKLEGPLARYNNAESEPKVKTNSLLIEKINHFITELRARDVVVNLRSSSGVDINAACGQLAVMDNKKSSL